jgi:hypothetical protein
MKKVFHEGDILRTKDGSVFIILQVDTNIFACFKIGGSNRWETPIHQPGGNLSKGIVHKLLDTKQEFEYLGTGGIIPEVLTFNE